MMKTYRGICILVFFNVIVSGEQSNEDITGVYGIDWMYFPDGDGKPQRISLHIPDPDEETLEPRAWSGYKDIEYRLYTRDNVDKYVILDEKAEPYNKTDLHIAENLSKAPVVLVTHGWKSSADQDAVLGIKDAYFASKEIKGSINVIGVDWSEYAAYFVYPSVAFETKEIGIEVAKFLNELGKRYNVSGHDVHLIGHSLGAHVMGNAGSRTDLRIARITGLDPARPFFEWPSRETAMKLDPSDADFVDVIHTCGGVLGMETMAGNADFYPNQGAAPQPGCDNSLVYMEACSHGRAHKLYAESVLNPHGFPAIRCDSWSGYLKGECSNITSYMGYGVTSHGGPFYLETNKDAPYARRILNAVK